MLPIPDIGETFASGGISPNGVDVPGGAKACTGSDKLCMFMCGTEREGVAPRLCRASVGCVHLAHISTARPEPKTPLGAEV